MPTYTQNLNMKKPFRGAEPLDIEVINGNMDILDEAVGALQDKSTTITPLVESGTKIADFNIDGQAGSLYAPSGGGGGSNVEITPTYESGEKIADYSIDGVNGELYVPNEFNGNVYADDFITNEDNHSFSETYSDVQTLKSTVENLVPVEANPEDTATDSLTKIDINGTVYSITGSGGSSVTPNPIGTPTDTLSTVEIDGTIYDIEGSGGESGHGVIKEVIYTGTERVNSITLDNGISNYDYILVVGYNVQEDGYINSSLIPTVDIGTNNRIGVNDDLNYIWYAKATDTTLTLANSSANSYYIKEIQGIKITSNSDDKPTQKLYTKLYDGNITSTGNITLLDSIENYDFILLEIAYLSGEGNPICGSTMANVPYIQANYNNSTSIWIDGGNNDRSAKVAFTSGTSMSVKKASQDDAIIGVYGLKLEVNINEGRSSSYNETTLWSGTDSATMQLSEPFENYDAVMIIAKTTYNSTEYTMSAIWTTSYLLSHINDGMKFGLTGDSWYVYFSITDDTTFAKQENYYLYISEIKGIKFGGGTNSNGGSLYSEALLYDSGSPITGAPFNQDVPLLKNLTKYDAVLIEWNTSQDRTDGSPNEETDTVFCTVEELLRNNFILHFAGYGTRWGDIKFTDTSFRFINRGGDKNPEIYRIRGLKFGGGSTGGSGRPYEKTLIWNSGSNTVGASYATDYTLLDNVSNYDQLILMVSTNGDRLDPNHQYSYQIWVDADYILESETWHNINVSGYGARYFEAHFTDTTFRIIQGSGESSSLAPTIYQIYGVKYTADFTKGIQTETIWNGLMNAVGLTRETSAPFTDFDYILLYGKPDEKEYHVSILDVPSMTNYLYVDGEALFSYEYYNTQYIRAKFTSPTHFICTQKEGNYSLTKMVGVRLNGVSMIEPPSEIIPISAGSDTTTRTFTFSRTPKFIKFYWGDPVISGGWASDADMVWGQAYMNYRSKPMGATISQVDGGINSLTYGADGKSVTLTGGNAFGAMNTSNGSGYMYVDYGGGNGASSSGGATKDVLYNNPSGAPVSTTLALSHNYTDYDIIFMKVSNATDISNFNLYTHTSFMPSMYGGGTERVSIQALYGTRVVDVTFSGATFTVARVDGDYRNTVYQIVGIKY